MAAPQLNPRIAIAVLRSDETIQVRMRSGKLMQKAFLKFQCIAPAFIIAGCGAASSPPMENHESASGEPAVEVPVEPPKTKASKKVAERLPASACLVQDGREIPENAIHAVGTEPFWAADVQGRCVTYSTPENQRGTRVWTRFSGSVEKGSWSGAFEKREFLMRTMPMDGCSDGMSDKRYPIAVTLKVGGEERRGCAERR